MESLQEFFHFDIFFWPDFYRAFVWLVESDL